MGGHVNNVRYVRWIETARIRYAESLDLPNGQVQGMLVSLFIRYSLKGKLTNRAGKVQGLYSKMYT